jgi:ABC-type branched-subunit amino acid transport system ATPase component
MMKGLIENECGGQNPLMKLTSHFVGPTATGNDQMLSQEALRNIQQQQKLNTPEQQLVSEYLGIESEKNARVAGLMHQKNNANQFMRRMPAPRSFQMEALFNELKHIDNLNAAAKSTSISTSALNTSNGSSSDSLAKTNAPTTTRSTLQPGQVAEPLNGLSRSVSPSKTLSAIRSMSQANNLPQEWSQEYWTSLSAAFKKQTPLIIDDRTFKWSTDYLTQTEATIFDEA